MVGSQPGEWRRAARRLSQSVVYRVPGERDDCPACGSSRLFDLDFLTLRRGRTAFVTGCDACGFVFTNPQPTPQELADFYSPSGTWGQPRADRDVSSEPRAARLGASWRGIFAPIRDELRVEAPPPAARVLDFGCGDGKLLDELQACGWKTFGIETAMESAFTRHERLDAVPDTETFDVIVAHHVLEHVPNPLELLRQFRRASRPGGFLFISVPRLDTLPIHRDYKYVMNGRSHISAYTWACLRTLLAKAGWDPIGLPPDDVSDGDGRRTRARLRVLARRAERTATIAEAPGNDARQAIRQYYSQGDSRQWLARIGLVRLAARATHARRRREAAARKVEKRSATAGTRPV